MTSPIAQLQQDTRSKQEGRQMKLQQDKSIQPYRMGQYQYGSSFGSENNNNDILMNPNGYQQQFLEESFGQKKVQQQQGDRQDYGVMNEQDTRKIFRLVEILMEKTFLKESFAGIVSAAADSIEAIRQQKQFSRQAQQTNLNNGSSMIAIHLSNSTNNSNNNNNNSNSGSQSTKNQDNILPLSTHFSRQQLQQNSQSIRSNSQFSRDDFSSHQRKLEMTVQSLEQKVKEQAIIIEQKTSKNNALLRHLVELQSSMELQENQPAEDEKQRNKGKQYDKEIENQISFLQSTIRSWQRKYEELQYDHEEIVKNYEELSLEKVYLLGQLDKMKKENVDIKKSMEIDVQWQANQWKDLWENEKQEMIEKNQEIIQQLNRKQVVVIKENEEIRGENEELLRHNEDLLGHNEELLKEYELLRSRMEEFVLENKVLKDNLHEKMQQIQIISAKNQNNNNNATNNSRSYYKNTNNLSEDNIQQREEIQKEIKYKQQLQDMRDRELRKEQELKQKQEEIVQMRQQLEETKRESQVCLKREREKSQRELQNVQMQILESKEQLQESKMKWNQMQMQQKEDLNLRDQRYFLGIRQVCLLMKNITMKGMMLGMMNIRMFQQEKIKQSEQCVESKKIKQNQTSSPMLLRKQQMQQVSYIEKRRMVSFGKYLFFKYKKAVQREFFKKLKIIHQQSSLQQAQLYQQNSQIIQVKVAQKQLGVAFQTWRTSYKLSRLCGILKNQHIQAHTREFWERIIAFAETKQIQQKTMELSRKVCKFSINFTRLQLRRAFARLQQNILIRNYSLNHRNIIFVRAVLKHKKNNLIAALNKWRYVMECAKVEETAAEINQTDSVIEKTEKIRSEVNLFLQSKEASLSTLLQGSTTPTRGQQQTIPRDFSPLIDPKKLRYSPSPIKANTSSEIMKQNTKIKRIDQIDERNNGGNQMQIQRRDNSQTNLLPKPSISPQQMTIASVGQGSLIIPNGQSNNNWFSESKQQQQLINKSLNYNRIPAQKNDYDDSSEEYDNNHDSNINNNGFHTRSSKSESISKKYQIPQQQGITSPQNQLQLKNYQTKNLSEKSHSSFQSNTLVEQKQYFQQPENLYSEKPIQKRNKLTK